MAEKVARPTGRPPFAPTRHQRQTVTNLRLSYASDAVIARALRIDPATLRKHFRRELDQASDQCKARLLMHLHDAAEAGNVAAIIRLDTKLMAGARTQTCRGVSRSRHRRDRRAIQAADLHVGSPSIVMRSVMSFKVKVRVKAWKLSSAGIAEIARRYRKAVDDINGMRDAPWGNVRVGPPSGCRVCGMSFTDPMGRPVAMGYVCGNARCPSQVRYGQHQVAGTGDLNLPSAQPSGLPSYYTATAGRCA